MQSRTRVQGEGKREAERIEKVKERVRRRIAERVIDGSVEPLIEQQRARIVANRAAAERKRRLRDSAVGSAGSVGKQRRTDEEVTPAGGEAEAPLESFARGDQEARSRERGNSEGRQALWAQPVPGSSCGITFGQLLVGMGDEERKAATSDQLRERISALEEQHE